MLCDFQQYHPLNEVPVAEFNITANAVEQRVWIVRGKLGNGVYLFHVMHADGGLLFTTEEAWPNAQVLDRHSKSVQVEDYTYLSFRVDYGVNGVYIVDRGDIVRAEWQIPWECFAQ